MTTFKKVIILLLATQNFLYPSVGPVFSQEEKILLNTQIPKEPGWKDPSYRGWEIASINGLIATYYDLNRDGNLDYMVMRRMMRKVESRDMTVDSAIETAQRENLSVYISTPVIYFASRYPMFYCLGVDSRRNCSDIWIDIQEDGLNGNEVLYTLSEPKIPVR
ncbi:MAG: hypothetical protein A3K09_08515 [Nitrospinae bacterium RIFCSPLOWO2_12_FULL_47_7]|nr:MAG: hypothetical protein A3K09_08515 [Nitrospinae bacterium RIFCSPLOWO2_12_FULL_47_7]